MPSAFRSVIAFVALTMLAAACGSATELNAGQVAPAPTPTSDATDDVDAGDEPAPPEPTESATATPPVTPSPVALVFDVADPALEAVVTDPAFTFTPDGWIATDATAVPCRADIYYDTVPPYAVRTLERSGDADPYAAGNAVASIVDNADGYVAPAWADEVTLGGVLLVPAAGGDAMIAAAVQPGTDGDVVNVYIRPSDYACSPGEAETGLAAAYARNPLVVSAQERLAEVLALPYFQAEFAGLDVLEKVVFSECEVGVDDPTILAGLYAYETNLTADAQAAVAAMAAAAAADGWSDLTDSTTPGSARLELVEGGEVVATVSMSSWHVADDLTAGVSVALSPGPPGCHAVDAETEVPVDGFLVDPAEN